MVNAWDREVDILVASTGKRAYGTGTAVSASLMQIVREQATESLLAALERDGTMVQANTPDRLTTKVGMSPTRLAATVRRFNAFARRGVDEDFSRGESAYDRYYGDPTVRPNPNPNLGPGPARAQASPRLRSSATWARATRPGPDVRTARVDEVQVVVAHQARATLRVGNVFLKIDADQTMTDREVEAMARAPIPTPRVLWRRPPVLAIAAVPGQALGRLGEPSPASPAAWAAAGAAVRTLHEAPLPPWPGRSVEDFAAELDSECEWLVANDVLPADLVTRNREVAEAALRPWTPVFIHGDLQISHVFADDDDRVTGVIDWSEAARGDALYDLAILTLGHEEHLGDLAAGYGSEVDLDVIRAWWSMHSLLASRWLVEHGFDPDTPGCEFDVLRARM